MQIRNQRLFAFSGEHVPNEIHQRFFFVIGELAGVEEQSVADSASFVLYVRLTDVNHADHRRGAFRAIDILDLIELFADYRIADVNCLGVLEFFQVLSFEHVEPDALAVRAAVDFDSPEFHGLH